MFSASSPLADQFAEVEDKVIAVKLLVEGVFDKRITELKAEKKAIYDRQLIVDTLKGAEKIKAQAEDDAARTVAEAQALKGRVEVSLADSQKKAAEVSEREKAVAEREGAVETAQKANARAVQALKDEREMREREAASRESALNIREGDLKAREDVLASRQAKLEAALKA